MGVFVAKRNFPIFLRLLSVFPAKQAPNVWPRVLKLGAIGIFTILCSFAGSASSVEQGPPVVGVHLVDVFVIVNAPICWGVVKVALRIKAIVLCKEHYVGVDQLKPDEYLFEHGQNAPL